MELRKNPEVDIRKQRSFYFSIGLLIALSLGLVAFEWRSYEVRITQLLNNVIDEEVEEVIIATQATPPPPPPPPPPSIVEVLNIVENDVEIENEVEVVDVETNESDEVSDVTDFSNQGEQVEDDNTVFEIVEDKARFAGCENEKTEQDADRCFNEKLARFLQSNLKYPQQAKELNIQGKVFVQFIVEKDGTVSNVTTLRGIGGGCDEEAVRVVSRLPKFTPGRQRGRPVRMMYRLPITFQLQ